MEENAPWSQFSKLMKEINRLHDEKTQLISKSLTLETDLGNTRDKHQRELTQQQEKCQKLEQDSSRLQEEVIKLRSLKVSTR